MSTEEMSTTAAAGPVQRRVRQHPTTVYWRTPEQAVIDALEQEVAALRKDATRYRWLRSNPQWLGWDHDFMPEEVEREIDAAMATTPDIGAA